MGRPAHIFVDMDGVQAVYGFGDSIEDMAAPGYFRTRPVQKEAVELVRRLHADPEVAVTILTSVFADAHSIDDKKYWLEKQGLSEVDVLFVPCGTPKSKYVSNEECNILIDDFSRNLLEWERNGENFVGIKYLNGGNASKGTWYAHGGYTMSCNMSVDRMIRLIKGVALAQG